jgi:opacity protein-like surface antigen
MMMHLVVLLLALVVPASAFAEEAKEPHNESYGRPGFYIGFVAFGAIQTFDDPESVDFSNGGGFNLRVGYRLTEHIAINGQYEYADGFEASGSNPFDVRDISSFTGNLKLYFGPGRLQAFVEVGLGVFVTDDVGDDRFDNFDPYDFGTSGVARLGGGLDFYLTEKVVLSGEVDYMKPFKLNKEFSYVTIGAGVSYRF